MVLKVPELADLRSEERDVVHVIIRRAMKGALLPGQRLPGVATLSRSLGHRLSPHAVMKAYRYLCHVGLLDCKKSSGHYLT